MTDMQALVREFHNTFGHPNPTSPTLIDKDTADFRWDIFWEEYEEYLYAVQTEDIIEIADALGDMLYILYGTATTHGINIGPVLEEIHRSNMSKLGEDGKPIFREDGKVLKGPNYFRPNIAAVLND